MPLCWFVEGVIQDRLKQDPSEGCRLYRKGAEAGNARCKINLAYCLSTGCGVELDLHASRELYEDVLRGPTTYPRAMVCVSVFFCFLPQWSHPKKVHVTTYYFSTLFIVPVYGTPVKFCGNAICGW